MEGEKISRKHNRHFISLIKKCALLFFFISFQAIYRVYRYGQEKNVFVYRLLSSGSMEEKIYKKQVTKQGKKNIDNCNQKHWYRTLPFNFSMYIRTYLLNKNVFNFLLHIAFKKNCCNNNNNTNKE